MFFDQVSQIPELIIRSGFSIFILPDSLKLDLPSHYLQIYPENNGKITVDQVREFTGLVGTKQSAPRFIIFHQAEALTESASNALLKILEEPQHNYHFALFASSITKLLPTIRSRAQIYFLSSINSTTSINLDPEILKLAKVLISADLSELIKISEQISKAKDSRVLAIKVVQAAIEILYKSFFITKNPKFLKRLPNFLQLEQHLNSNGHLKLHFVADLC